MPTDTDYIPTHRAALVAWWLAHGEILTAPLIARRLGMTWEGAYYLLSRISRVLPVCEDGAGPGDTRWYVVQDIFSPT